MGPSGTHVLGCRTRARGGWRTALGRGRRSDISWHRAARTPALTACPRPPGRAPAAPPRAFRAPFLFSQTNRPPVILPPRQALTRSGELKPLLSPKSFTRPLLHSVLDALVPALYFFFFFFRVPGRKPTGDLSWHYSLNDHASGGGRRSSSGARPRLEGIGRSRCRHVSLVLSPETTPLQYGDCS